MILDKASSSSKLRRTEGFLIFIVLDFTLNFETRGITPNVRQTSLFLLLLTPSLLLNMSISQLFLIFLEKSAASFSVIRMRGAATP